MGVIANTGKSDLIEVAKQYLPKEYPLLNQFTGNWGDVIALYNHYNMRNKANLQPDYGNLELSFTVIVNAIIQG